MRAAMVYRALTIAGSDCSGGAGIQADIKTFTVLRVYGMTALTALTAQNTCGVEEVHVVPAPFVARQMNMALSDIGADAAKTGMLYAPETVVAVARAIKDHHLTKVVVDPVLVAQSGANLGRDDLPAALLEELIPHALLVTPNLDEASVLTGIQVRSIEDMREVARQLVAAGARACLVKGGHLEGEDAVDVYDDGRRSHQLTSPRLPTRHTHGTGCQLSAAVTAYLARGLSLDEAVARAKRFINAAIAGGLAIGHGPGPANPMAWTDED
jgi:hydroxymethylpyrimidine/phosphomethylpyrimidine kinase